MCRANDNETFSDPLQPFHVYFQLAPSRLNGYFFSTLRRYKNLNNTVATRGKVLHAAVHSLQSFDKSLDQVSMGRRKRQRKKNNNSKRAEISSHEMWKMLKAFSVALLSCLNQIMFSLKSFSFPLKFLAWLSEAESLSETAEALVRISFREFVFASKSCHKFSSDCFFIRKFLQGFHFLFIRRLPRAARLSRKLWWT